MARKLVAATAQGSGTAAVDTAHDIGAVIRAVRNAQGLRQDEIPGVSHKFVLEIERGKPTAHLGKVLDVLRELGVRVQLDLPAGIHVELSAPTSRS